ncbi:MAG: S24 family peptidase [Dysgonomonas sp.]
MSNTNKLVPERFQAIIDNSGLSTAAFSKEIGFDRADKIYNILNGKFNPSYDILLAITNKFVDINIDWLISGKGSMLKSKNAIQAPTTKSESNVIPVDFSKDIDTIEIPIVDVYAAAGHGSINSDYLEQTGTIRLPANMVKRGTNYCVRVEGHSMSPTIQDNDYVIVRLLEPSEWKHMPDEHVHLIVDRDGAAYIKRIKNKLEKGFIVCTSDSLEKSIYPNFNLQADQIFNIFHAEWYLSAKMQNINETYYNRLKLLEDDMSEMKDNMSEIRNYMKRIKE